MEQINRKWPRLWIATLVTFIFAGTLWMLFGGEVFLDETKEKLAFILVGGLMTNFTCIVGFYFQVDNTEPK